MASIAQWAIYKKARKLGFKVLLGGLGGDELFYGYPIQNRCGEALKVRYTLQSTRSRWEWLKVFLRHIRFEDPHRRMHLDERWPVDFTYNSYLNFAKTALLRVNGDDFNFKDLNVSFTYPYKSAINTVYDLQFSNFMTAQCLYLADRLGMGNSVELRSPMVDYKLVEFISYLSIDIKYNPHKPKQFLKDALAGLVPNNILYAPKRGFTPPNEYINDICRTYKYRRFNSDYPFFNSMMADSVLANVITN